MNLRKGFLRILILAFCYLLGIKFTMAMFQVIESAVTFDNVFDCVTIFAIVFYIPASFILLANSVEPESKRFFDIDFRPTKIIYVISMIFGFFSFGTYFHLRPDEPHNGVYFIAFAIPLILIFNGYITVLWIIDGFRN